MAFIPKDLSGSLFKNDKGDNAARPDYRGDAMIDGTVYEIAAWIKPMASDANKRYMSLSFKAKEQQAAPAPAFKKPSQDGAKARQLPPQDFDDGSDIPF